MANQLIMTTVWTAAIARTFTVSRGLAMAVTMIGSALAVAVAPLAVDFLIHTQGWRVAFVIMGLCTGITVVVICWLALIVVGPRRKPAVGACPKQERRKWPARDDHFRRRSRSFAFIKLVHRGTHCQVRAARPDDPFDSAARDGGLARQSAV